MYFFIGGTASYAAYAIVVWACLYLPIAVVSSLRETSILFAVLLGVFFLKEKINLTKSLLILGLFFGVIILRLNWFFYKEMTKLILKYMILKNL